MSALPKSPLTFDQILDEGSPSQAQVPLCLNGRLVQQYEAVIARIGARAADRAAAARVAGRVDPDDPDRRLGTRAPGVPVEVRDPEQEEADRLQQEMRRFTVVFTLANIGAEYNKLIQAHPPRRDPADAKRLHPHDSEGFNSITFFPALVRLSLAEPEMTDARWEKLLTGRARISDAQFERLAEAAVKVNRRDHDLPFSLGDLESHRR
ncbi:hypothetical protein [Actinoplanes sp. NBRC 101535]|uniref:hypothetical protein n=1 Tax=Actinoplanes sp. NBRC 101535 TaxID=3032196 RepID=UPI0024A59353|nr:hypothetical protein [Actinoplanes sp. NBRC 101535]GLY08272.1 hypothetical protein Acsp01_86510 [Actinoplanes sp. NBRC 101535]